MINRNKLKVCINEGMSQRAIATVEGVSQSTIKYWLKKHNLKTVTKSGPRRTKESGGFCESCGKTIKHPNRFCDARCKSTLDAKSFGERWVTEGYRALPEHTQKSGIFNGKARRFIFIDKGSKCERCEWTYSFGDNSFPPLEVHHKDGNYKNNNYDNLELLCPNCHAIDTRLNPVKIGNGRWLNGDDCRN